MKQITYFIDLNYYLIFKDLILTVEDLEKIIVEVQKEVEDVAYIVLIEAFIDSVVVKEKIL